MKKIIIGATLALGLTTAGSASATKYVFTSTAAPTTINGVSVAVTGWANRSTDATTSPVASAAILYPDNGYGVINPNGDTYHTIDNLGSYDFLQLVFSRPVMLNTVSLKAFGGTDAWVSYGSTALTGKSTAAWDQFIKNGSTFLAAAGTSSDRSFEPMKAIGTVWLIGAGRLGAGSNDSFKVTAVDVTAVPEPAAWAMMIVGFGAVGTALRRRPKPAARVAIA